MRWWAFFVAKAEFVYQPSDTQQPKRSRRLRPSPGKLPPLASISVEVCGATSNIGQSFRPHALNNSSKRIFLNFPLKLNTTEIIQPIYINNFWTYHRPKGEVESFRKCSFSTQATDRFVKKYLSYGNFWLSSGVLINLLNVTLETSSNMQIMSIFSKWGTTYLGPCVSL